MVLFIKKKIRGKKRRGKAGEWTVCIIMKYLPFVWFCDVTYLLQFKLNSKQESYWSVSTHTTHLTF